MRYLLKKFTKESDTVFTYHVSPNDAYSIRWLESESIDDFDKVELLINDGLITTVTQWEDGKIMFWEDCILKPSDIRFTQITIRITLKYPLESLSELYAIGSDDDFPLYEIPVFLKDQKFQHKIFETNPKLKGYNNIIRVLYGTCGKVYSENSN